MKDFNGTPGPWYRGGVENGKVSINAGEYFVALVDEGLAQNFNAQLIAAAPDLLEALQQLFSHYKELADSGDAGNWKLEDESVGKKAMAAISKALGEE